jgi:DNA-binding beta-propeller fold protein YncE
VDRIGRQKRNRLLGAIGVLAAAVLGAAGGCEPQAPQGADAVVRIIGRRGRGRKRFIQPRVLDCLDKELFVIDRTGRIQVFDLDGTHKRQWMLPEFENGYPTGMGISPDGRLYVADTHYGRVLILDRKDGKRLGQLGGPGRGDGQFTYPTDVAFDSRGAIYVAEFGGNDRISKFTPDGRFLLSWDGSRTAAGKFQRPAAVAVDPTDRVWVADAANHRLCLFDTTGKLLEIVGHHGGGRGELRYPYDLILEPDGRHVLVVEFGNHRLQRFDLAGRSVGSWGTVGHGKGQLMSPWACGVSRASPRDVYVVDYRNDRVVQVRFPPP